MIHTITAVLCLRYKIAMTTEKDPDHIVGEYTYRRIYKGSRPEGFINRPEIHNFTDVLSVSTSQNFFTAYQVVDTRFDVEGISEGEFENRIRQYLSDNFHNKYEDDDGSFDSIAEVSLVHLDILEVLVSSGD